MDCIQSCVFGQSELDKKLSYFSNGVETKMTLAQFMTDTFHHLFMRTVEVLRNLTTMFDKHYVTKYEKEIQKNLLGLRAFIKDLIKVKREQIN